MDEHLTMAIAAKVACFNPNLTEGLLEC